MIHPELADKIINVLKPDSWTTPTNVATDMGESVEKVSLTMREMASLKPFWLSIQSDDGIDNFSISKRAGFENEIILWKQCGGFVKYQADIENENFQKQADKELHKKNLMTTTAQAEQAIFYSKEARRSARQALIVAWLAIILSLLIWLFGTLQK